MFEAWFVKLFLNICSYSSIVLPVVIIIYLVKNNYLTKLKNFYLIQIFVYGKKIDNIYDDIRLIKLKEKEKKSRSTTSSQRYITLLFCFLGLNLAYLIWGIYQEKIMTKYYTLHSSGKEIHFSDSQFCVFINRIFAFIFASILCITIKSEFNAPLSIFLFASLSNVISSWCQYEALKYVNFPTQVLSKACKIPCVMLMSTLIKVRKYLFIEYLCAILISLGMTIFILGDSKLSIDIINGLLILAIYLASDSFTSNWQEKIFSNYTVSCFTMMSILNGYSLLLTITSMAAQDDLNNTLDVLKDCSQLQLDLAILAFCGFIGQLFVFYTIRVYGALVFTSIMMIRQFLAIALSSVIYDHRVNWNGLLIVFAGLLGLKIINVTLKCDKKN